MQALDQLEALSKMYDSITYGELRYSPFWDALRGDPRFEALVVNLTPMLGPRTLDASGQKLEGTTSSMVSTSAASSANSPEALLKRARIYSRTTCSQSAIVNGSSFACWGGYAAEDSILFRRKMRPSTQNALIRRGSKTWNTLSSIKMFRL